MMQDENYLRLYFAARAIAGAAASGTLGDLSHPNVSQVARSAFMLADAMVKEFLAGKK
jgi:hypothetical protein